MSARANATFVSQVRAVPRRRMGGVASHQLPARGRGALLVPSTAQSQCRTSCVCIKEGPAQPEDGVHVAPPRALSVAGA